MRKLLFLVGLAANLAFSAVATATPICDGDGCSDGSYGRCCDSVCGCKAPLVCNFEFKTIGTCVTPDELPKDTGVVDSAATETGASDVGADAAEDDSTTSDASVDAALDAAKPATGDTTESSSSGCSCTSAGARGSSMGALALLPLAVVAVRRRSRRAAK